MKGYVIVDDKKIVVHERKYIKMDAFQIILYVIVSLYCLTMLAVLAFGVINSLKTVDDYEYLNPFGLPHAAEGGWQFVNYIKVFSEFTVTTVGAKEVGLIKMFFNSILYAGLMSLFCVATQVITAYAVAKYNFKGKNIIYAVAIIVMILPIIGSLASEVQIADAFGFRNSVLGVCLMRCKYTGIYFLVFYATFKSLSWSYAEAAQIDGASHFGTFFHIMLPLIKGTIFAVFILLFIEHWNDYYTPLVFLPEKPTLSYGLFTFQDDNAGSIPLQFSACFLASIPILLVFIAFKDKIMGNVTMGGIKG